MRKISLREILFDLLHRATKSQGARFSHTLGGGLTLIVMVYGGKTWLALSRPDILPSLVEFETVSRNWPYPIPGIKSQAGKGFSLITELDESERGRIRHPVQPRTGKRFHGNATRPGATERTKRAATFFFR